MPCPAPSALVVVETTVAAATTTLGDGVNSTNKASVGILVGDGTVGVVDSRAASRIVMSGRICVVVVVEQEEETGMAELYGMTKATRHGRMVLGN